MKPHTRAAKERERDPAGIRCSFQDRFQTTVKILAEVPAPLLLGNCWERAGPACPSVSGTSLVMWLQCLFASATHHQEKSATCIHAFPLSLEPPSHPRQPTPLGRHRALSWARCTAASPRYFTHGGVYMPMLLSQFVPPTSSPSPQALSLLLCLYSCPANSSSIPFF